MGHVQPINDDSFKKKIIVSTYLPSYSDKDSGSERYRQKKKYDSFSY